MGKTPKSPQMTSASMQCPSLTQEETESQFIRAPCCGVDGVFIFTPPVSSWTRKQRSQGSSSFWCCQVNDFHSSEFAILSNELPSISIDVDLFYGKKNIYTCTSYVYLSFFLISAVFMQATKRSKYVFHANNCVLLQTKSIWRVFQAFVSCKNLYLKFS